MEWFEITVSLHPHSSGCVALFTARCVIIDNDEYDLQIRTDKSEYTDLEVSHEFRINSQNAEDVLRL